MNITLHDREAPPYDRHLTPRSTLAPRPEKAADKTARRRRRLALSLPVAATLLVELALQLTSLGSLVAAVVTTPFAVATIVLAVHLWRAAGRPADAAA